MKADLGRRRILICRPRAAARELALAVAAAGGRAVMQPAMRIAPFAGVRLRRFCPEKFDASVFVSANAVTHFCDFVRRPAAMFPPCIAAVGEVTAAALRARGAATVIAPRGFGGAARLLSLAAFAPARIAAKKIALICAQGGSRALREELRARGAKVTEIACYRRLPPKRSPPPKRLSPPKRGARIAAVDAAAVFSVATLDNLLVIAPDLPRDVPLFVIHPQIAAAARARGFSTIITAASGALIAAITAHFRNRNEQRRHFASDRRR